MPKRSWHFEVDFCSPSETLPSPGHLGGVKAPTLLLQSRNADFMNPVHLGLPPRPVSRTSGELYNQDPLNTLSTLPSMANPIRRSLSGLAPLQIKAPEPACHLRNLPLAMPDFPSLPTGGIVKCQHRRIIVPGPLHSLRLAVPSRRPSGLRKTTITLNSLAHRTTWLRSDLPAI